jgi:regulator of sigma E protease
LAFVFGTIVWIIGRPVSEKETTTTVGYLPAEYVLNNVTNEFPAHKVGLQPGDQIVAIDGQHVSRFSGVSKESIMWRIVSSEGDTINVEVKRDNVTTNFNIVPIRPDTKSYQRKGLRQIGIEPSYSALVAKVYDGSPAAKAGIKVNDFVVAVNGKPVHHPAHAGDMIRAGTNGPVELKLERNGAAMSVFVKPEIPIEGEKMPRIGIVWDDTGKMTLVNPSPYEQVKAGVDSMVGTFAALFSPKSDIKAQHLSGPLGIMRIYYLLFQSDQGWRLAIWFSVVLNVNLAILNMLPVPVLDGGHITLAMISAISRREIDSRVLNWIQTACVFLVIGYICYVSFYDVQDLKPAKEPKEAPAQDMRFAPDSSSSTNTQK